MRRIVPLVVLAAAGVWVAGQVVGEEPKKAGREAPAAAPAADPEAARKLDEVLAEWGRRAAEDRSLSVRYTRTEVSKIWNEVKRYEVRAMLQRPDLACLEIHELVPGKPPAFHERIVCDGKAIYQMKAATKQVFVIPLDAPKAPRGGVVERGPMPLLLGLSADEAKARYQLTLVADEPGQYHIRALPTRPEDRDEFREAHVLLSKKTLLPRMIQLVRPNGKDRDVLEFRPKDIARNVAIPAENFDGAAMAKKFAKAGYKVVEPPAPADARARPGVRPAGRS